VAGGWWLVADGLVVADALWLYVVVAGGWWLVARLVAVGKRLLFGGWWLVAGG